MVGPVARAARSIYRMAVGKGWICARCAITFFAQVVEPLARPVTPRTRISVHFYRAPAMRWRNPFPQKTMKRLNVVTFVAGLLLPLSPVYPAAESAAHQTPAHTATITGRVQNEITGRYLNNARVSVKGTDLRVLTDESGLYRLNNAPAGRILLEVVYSGLEKQEVEVEATPGQTLVKNVNLAPPGAQTVKMDAYVVGASKAMDQSAIAINEQRFAPNIKTVVSTGDLAEHAGGSIAEFLKYVPGIAIDDARPGGTSVSVRGFPSNQTQVTQDGAAASNASTTSDTRNLGTRMTMGLTSVARIEVTKVPTPSTGADTMAGSVNLVSRNAFESAKPEFRYTLTISGEHTHITDAMALRREYSLFDDKKIFYASPSMNFTFAHPVTKNFGYTISGMYDKMSPTQLTRIYTQNVNSPTFGSTPSAPVWTSNLLIFGGQIGERANLGLTADWRVTPNSVLSAGLQLYDSSNYNGDYRVGFNTGTVATPTVTGGVAGSYGPDYTVGATGRGAVTYSHNTQVQFYSGARTNLRYNFDNGDWKVDLKVAPSLSIFKYRTLPKNGFIRSVNATSTAALRVEFRDIDPVTGPGKNLVYDNNNQLVDTGVAAFHNQTAITSATTLNRDTTDKVWNYNADVRRTLGFSPFPAAIKIGAARKTQERDRWNDIDSTYTYNGPNGNLSPAPFLTPAFDTPGASPHVLVSPYRAADAWGKTPGLFFQTPAQIVATERLRRQNSEVIAETADALYAQVEARLFSNRLNVLTGVRYERTASDGTGSLNTPDGVWQRNANGSFVVGSNGARVRKPEAGAAGSLQELDFIWHERAARSKRTYDGYYPSLHLTYNFTEKFQSRAAYAKTYGRPNFSFVIPRTVVTEFTNQTGAVTGGQLTVRNPGLLPWTADNYDLTTEYYTDQGGVFGANVFRKDVVNFFGSVTRDATPDELKEVGVTPQAGEPWTLVTTNNVGNARIQGWELNANQSLSVLDPWVSGWGSSFRVFANITKITLKGDRTADFTGFLPTSASWGFQFARKRVGASLKWNYRSDQNQGAVTNLGANGYNYVPARTHLDVNLSYNLRPNFGFFIQMRNVMRVFQQPSKKSDVLPAYARVSNLVSWDGITTNLGIKGSF